MTTKSQFLSYEIVRKSGKTNMLDLSLVVKLSFDLNKISLTRDIILDIQKNYEEYKRKWANEYL